MNRCLLSVGLWTALCPLLAEEKPSLSGIYPHLAMFNRENECGTGAVVPWADRLWVITYAPHQPRGSSDKLYEITPDLRQIVRPESIGGTPANRMIHEESRQLFIGPYAIDADRQVRAVPYSSMFGRPTGTARHLHDPAGRVMHATMEEGIYEVNVETLEVRELFADEQQKTDRRKAGLPGYHGKGFYSGQGVYVYSNNGEHGNEARVRPDVPSGVLAEWDGRSDDWKVIRRSQFTEVTGPGGIHGNRHPGTDPIWAVGWDAKSLLLGVRKADEGWSFHRLPKGSHSYDGAHGWNTEWPRIREIGEEDMLMTMHGTFWRFPKDFGVDEVAGIRPRSNYLKVIGDFCRWKGRVVLGCDDTAKSEFLNKRKAKGEIAAPQSQSNLWFVEPSELDHFGPVIGRGAVWMKEPLAAGALSDPFLFAGYAKKGLHLSHGGSAEVQVEIGLLDRKGKMRTATTVAVPAGGYRFVDLDDLPEAEWIRLKALGPIKQATAVFTYRNDDHRTEQSAPIFKGLAHAGGERVGGLLRARDGDKRSLSFAPVNEEGQPLGYYEMGAGLGLSRVDDDAAEQFTRKKAAISPYKLGKDEASVVYTDDNGNRWRFPGGEEGTISGSYRIAREVATERDLLHIDGSFYELPARNAGGVSKARPVATHHRLVHDFCSYRGLLIMSGVDLRAGDGNPHIIRSDDGKVAVWAGAIDDIWKLGKPRGVGGPWKQTKINADAISDPYLMTAYDHKELLLEVEHATTITAQIDIHGDGTWVDYRRFTLPANGTRTHVFPDSFSAYWIRFVSDADTTATAILTYR